MKVLFACGGTGGHINPAVAVAKHIKERHPEAEICFIGASGGMEARLIPEAGFDMRTLNIEGFKHNLSIKSACKNTRITFKVLRSLRDAGNIIREFKPDIAVGTGGFVGFPVIYKASKSNIPTVIHEANAYPGLTTRVLSRYAERILVNFKESRKYFKSRDIEVVGMPVREDILFKDRDRARSELKLTDKPLVISFWGSLGARDMNKIMAEFIKKEMQYPEVFHHIHATGKFGYAWMPKLLNKYGYDPKKYPFIEIREYISDMPRVLTAADLVMCRAGASTISEITALGKPAIIVPSPNVTANHQEINASVLKKQGAAEVIHEKDCTPELLYDTAITLLNNPEKCAEMSRRLNETAILDATERIYNVIITTVNNRKHTRFS